MEAAVSYFLDFYVPLAAKGHLRINHTFIFHRLPGRNASHQNTSKKLAQCSTHNIVNSKHNQSKIVINTHHLFITEKDTSRQVTGGVSVQN